MRNLIILCFISLILYMCYDATSIKEGVSIGLRIWYMDLIPVVLPFILVSNLCLNYLTTIEPSPKASTLILLTFGLLCGYPTGAIIASRMTSENIISTSKANAMLPLVSNISPMFLVGYVSNMCPAIPLIKIIVCIYLPQIIYMCTYLYMCKTDNITLQNNVKDHTEYDTNNSIIDTAIHTITVIGMYICIFSVIANVLIRIHPGTFSKIIASFLEITRGIQTLSSLDISKAQKTGLILALVSSGGISSFFQIIHIIKKSVLSLSSYAIGKILCGISTYILVVIIF